jgi:signal peptidase II
MTPSRRKYAVFAAIFLTVLITDQTTKYLAVKNLTHAFEHFGARTFGERLKVYLMFRNLDGDPPEPDRPDLRTPPVVVVNNFWNLKYVENPGAAWGMFSRQAPWFRVPFFHIVSLIAIGFMSVYIRRLEPTQRLLLVALSLVLGGAVGNYVDRVMRSYVIDFVDWHWFDDPRLHWPTFNVADAAICVGVALMIGETGFSRKKPAPALVSAKETEGLASGTPSLPG